MALKPDRDYFEDTDIANYWSELEAQETAEKGGVAAVESAGSGTALGTDTTSGGNVVQYAVDPSGAIAKGVLLQPVNPALSATRDFKNFSNLEARPGEKVTLLRKGWVVTDMITGTPSAGDAAYLAASGNVSPSQATGAPQVGRFETSKDADGFARVYIDI